MKKGMKYIAVALLFFTLTVFITACGNKKSSDSKSKSNYTISEFFKENRMKPLIMYYTDDDEIGKDTEIIDIYLIKGGKCLTYHNALSYDGERIKLGELSKMSDEEIIKKLEEEYEERFNEALENWKKGLYSLIEDGTIEFYEPQYYDITTYIETDSTGNNVAKEIVALPYVGPNNNAYVILNSKESYDATFYSSRIIESYYSHDIEYGKEKMDDSYNNPLSRTNTIFEIQNPELINAEVYDSNYYAFETDVDEYGKNHLIFRNKSKIKIEFDEPKSEKIYKTDPSGADLALLSLTQYDLYHHHFNKKVSVSGKTKQKTLSYDEVKKYEKDIENFSEKAKTIKESLTDDEYVESEIEFVSAKEYTENNKKTIEIIYKENRFEYKCIIVDKKKTMYLIFNGKELMSVTYS